MSNTSTILFGSYTNKNTNTVVSSPFLTCEIGMLNKINQLRADLNLRAARNVYPWWVYTLATLTYFPKGHFSSMIDIDEFLKDAEVNVRNLRQHSTLLNNSIEGQAPSKVAREYTGKLPKLVKMLKLRSQRMTEFYGKGRKPIGFCYVDPVAARVTLLEQYPDTLHLFDQLDYNNKK